MKRFCSSDSLAALLSVSTPKEEKARDTNQGYSKEFQAMLDSLEEDEEEEEEGFNEEATARRNEKKRRLTLDQVKALEKSFEVENKLEPERKLKLAEELRLQPRQVAIWFQNRRARWKTKQLERDYGTLKANYEALKHDYSNLQHENEALSLELKNLESKFKEERVESSHSVKEEYPVSESENNASVQSQNHDFTENTNFVKASAIKDHCSNVSSSSHPFTNWIQFSDSTRTVFSDGYPLIHQFNHPLLKLEEHQSLFSAEESCNFLSVDQAPTLHWHFHPET